MLCFDWSFVIIYLSNKTQRDDYFLNEYSRSHHFHFLFMSFNNILI